MRDFGENQVGSVHLNPPQAIEVNRLPGKSNDFLLFAVTAEPFALRRPSTRPYAEDKGTLARQTSGLRGSTPTF